MDQDRAEKYLRALPKGYTVTVIEINATDFWNEFHRISNLVGRKVRDGKSMMVVEFDQNVYDEEKKKYVIKMELPYSILTCETIRVMEKIAPDDIYSNLSRFEKSVDEELKKRKK